MKESDYFSLHNRINFLKHELEMALAKQDEVTALMKGIHVELAEISKAAPLAVMPGAAGGDTKVYKECGNPDSQTSLEKVGDGG